MKYLAIAIMVITPMVGVIFTHDVRCIFAYIAIVIIAICMF
jgi:hypothetical protein